jgi:hypothetical protein
MSSQFIPGDRVEAPLSNGDMRTGIVTSTQSFLVWVEWDEPVVETKTTRTTAQAFMGGRVSMIEPAPRTLIQQFWREYERGWGDRPDGYTLHLNEEGRERFVKEFLRKQDARAKGRIPDEFSKPDGAQNVTVSVALYAKVRSEIEDDGETLWRTRPIAELEQEAAS